MTTAEILAAFSRLSALVVGDICLDRWCRYDPSLSEASVETGIPRIAVIGSESTPGAAGTIANNLAALRAGRVSVLGAIGADGHGFELRRALAARSVESDHVIEDPAMATFTYTKLINDATGREDLSRVDFINARPPLESTQAALVDRLEQVAAEFDVILVSDQAETAEGGVVTGALRNALARLAARHPAKVMWADSRRRPELFRDVIVKPNEREAAEACARIGADSLDGLRRAIGEKPLIVTRGGDGAEIWTAAGIERVTSTPVANPVDICGAGDSFSAGAALALAVTGDPVRAVRIGNLVASVTIMKPGTGTASPEELLALENRD